MSQISPQQARFEEVLQLSGADLKNFYIQTPGNLFPDAATFPEFFHHNLLSPSRVIKCLRNDPHSNLRVFYFNLFRLSYYIIGQNTQNDAALLNLRNYVLHPQFQILFTPDSQPERQLYNDQQFKKFFAQFLNILDLQQAPDVQFILNSFPIIDTVLIHILRSVLAKQGFGYDFAAKIPTDTVFVELSNLFGLNLTAYGNCWKFEDCDMFCLEESEEEIYVTYIQEVDPEGELPMDENNGYSVDAVSMNVDSSKDKQEVVNPIAEVASNSTPYSSASYYLNQQISMQPPLIGATGSQPLIVSQHGSSASNSYSMSSREILTDKYPLSKFAQSNGFAIDQSSSLSDVQIQPAPEVKIQELFIPHKQGSLLKDSMSPGSSVISFVSETYEFVDFTNQKTLYKDKIPKNKITSDSPNTKPIVHSSDQFTNFSRDTFQIKKHERASPIYEGTSKYSTADGKFDFSKFDSPKYEPQYSSPKQFQSSSSYGSAKFQSSTFQSPQFSYELPKYQPKYESNYDPKYESIKYEPLNIRPPIPKLDISNRDSSYQPKYKPLYSIPQILSSVQSTQSLMNPAENTPIFKLQLRHPESQSKSILQSSVKPPFPPMTVSITNSITSSKDGGDYYKDFTNSFMLEKLEEPYRSNVRAIKNRIRGLRRKSITPSTFVVNMPPLDKNPVARALYEQAGSERIY